MVSVIISYYNEKDVLSTCLKSLAAQSYTDFEIITVNDGSTDNSKKIVQNAKLQFKLKKLTLLTQQHKGPASSRNLGANFAKGEILVFVDADITFEKKFLENLVVPIEKGKSKGTFTKEEYVSNWTNVWARCWNYNNGLNTALRIPQNYPSKAPVFRAILASEFKRVRGFDEIGYTDDWTLSRKLGYLSDAAVGAICYHRNPQSIKEVFESARWIGKNEFISGTLFRKIINLIRFSPQVQSIRAFILTIRFREIILPLFIIIYSLAVNLSIIESFVSEKKYK